MKKRRLLLVLVISLIFVLVFSFSSAIFELKTVDVVFFKNGQTLSSPETLSLKQKILNETSFDYGSSIFFVPNDKYNGQIEYNEPKIKVLGTEKVFPNKLLIKVCTREPVFFFSSKSKAYLLDSEFKLLYIQPLQEFADKLSQSESKIREISFSKNGISQDFFTFFDLNENVLTCGEFLSQNNKVFSATANIYCYFTLDSRFFDNIKTLCFSLNEQTVSLQLSTHTGLNMEVENVLKKFDEKLLKLCNAYFTLQAKEPIKTTHGTLKIDNNKNVFWRA